MVDRYAATQIDPTTLTIRRCLRSNLEICQWTGISRVSCASLRVVRKSAVEKEHAGLENPNQRHVDAPSGEETFTANDDAAFLLA